MHNQMKLSFAILLIFKEFFSIQGAVDNSTHDITSSLVDWINDIFEEDSNIHTTNSLVRSALASAEHHRIDHHQLEYELFDQNSEPLRANLIFDDINFYTHPIDASETAPIELRSWKSSNISISTKFLRITVEGKLRTEKSQQNVSYFTTLHFKNFALDAILISENQNEPKFTFDLSYDKFYAQNHGCNVNIQWKSSGNLTEDQIQSLNEHTEPALPILLHEHINRNPEFTKAFELISKTYFQPSDIISEHPDFLENRQMYYYLIPQIPYFGFNLRNVVIQGLSNIQRFDTHDEGSIFSRTLVIKNIHGSLTLDYGTDEEKPLELNYFVDYLSISINENTNFVQVEARSYSVNRTNGEPLSYRQSANVMQKLESGIASSLMPSKKVWKSIDMESEIGPVSTANKQEWKKIRQSYGDWVPFNQEQISAQSSLIRIIYAGGRLMPDEPFKKLLYFSRFINPSNLIIN